MPAVLCKAKVRAEANNLSIDHEAPDPGWVRMRPPTCESLLSAGRGYRLSEIALAISCRLDGVGRGLRLKTTAMMGEMLL